MKNKLFAILVNLSLCAIIVATAVVGFVGGGAVEVSSDGVKPYYKSDNPRGVSIMFNVYQNTSNVYKILDVLDEYSAKATFFLGGSWADDNVDCVREIYSRGHEVGSHGYFHKDHSAMTYKQNVDEIKPSVMLLNRILGTNITLFAPPSGAFNDSTLSACSEFNLKTIMWSRDTIDWRDDDVNLLYLRATSNLESGEFILMHPMDASVSVLPKILSYIRESGFSAVTVSYNLGE
ncbi:MAG: polysaccharide deacetylase family protein [Candidatus Coproplasma sp.]